jgi:hypothetical protein
MTVGDAGLWADVFPDALVPQIINLVWETWQAFEKPKRDEHEVPITRRFKRDLKLAKDLAELPLRIDREAVEDDLDSGDELGRIDLKFSPTERAREEVYFGFECKRLYAWVNGAWDACASKYVTDGMIRFANGQYAARMSHGGMIGYVLNGDCVRARSKVDRAVARNAKKLGMRLPARLESSSFRPELTDVCQTRHQKKGRVEFRLHHLFLAGHVAPRRRRPKAKA